MGNQVGPSSKFKQKNQQQQQQQHHDANSSSAPTSPSNTSNPNSAPYLSSSYPFLLRKQSVQSSSTSSTGGGGYNSSTPAAMTTAPPPPPPLGTWDATSSASSITLDVASAISSSSSSSASIPLLPPVPTSTTTTIITSQAQSQLTCNPEMMVASEVKPFLFLGGDQFVARNRDYLAQLKIKHVINCAGLSCENYYEDELSYTTLDLSDTSKECIFNFMLQTITDIESSRVRGECVLVHCVAGISRSATLVAAYLMFVHGYDSQEAITELRKARQCVDPNPRFIQELDRFRKRLDWQPSQPTLHRIAPHSPLVRALVPKPVYSGSDFSPPSVRHLHPRYTLVVHSPQHRTLFLWIGPEAEQQQEEERRVRQASKQTRKQHLLAEPYSEAGPRIGLMMTKMDKPFARLGCDFVHVPTLCDSVPAEGYTASFWSLLGVPVGTRVDVDFLWQHQRQYSSKWTEKDGDFAYEDTYNSKPSLLSLGKSLVAARRTSGGGGGSSPPNLSINITTSLNSSSSSTDASPTTLSPPAVAVRTGSVVARHAAAVNPNAPPSSQPPHTPVHLPSKSSAAAAVVGTPAASPVTVDAAAGGLPPRPVSSKRLSPIHPSSSSSSHRPPQFEEEEEGERRLPAPTAASSSSSTLSTHELLGLFPGDLNSSSSSSSGKTDPPGSSSNAVKREQGAAITDLDLALQLQREEELRKRTRSQSLNFEATSRKLSHAAAPVPAAASSTPVPPLSAVREDLTPKQRSRSVGTLSVHKTTPTPTSTPAVPQRPATFVARHSTAPLPFKNSSNGNGNGA